MQRPPFLLLINSAHQTQVICQPRRFRMGVYHLPAERMEADSNDLVMYGTCGSQLLGFVYRNWHPDNVEPLFIKAIEWYVEHQLDGPMELSPQVPGEPSCRRCCDI